MGHYSEQIPFSTTSQRVEMSGSSVHELSLLGQQIITAGRATVEFQFGHLDHVVAHRAATHRVGFRGPGVVRSRKRLPGIASGAVNNTRDRPAFGAAQRSGC